MKEELPLYFDSSRMDGRWICLRSSVKRLYQSELLSASSDAILNPGLHEPCSCLSLIALPIGLVLKIDTCLRIGFRKACKLFSGYLRLALSSLDEQPVSWIESTVQTPPPTLNGLACCHWMTLP